MSPVRIVDVSYVAVPAEAAMPLEPINLNAMEVQWLLLPLLQHILLFEGDHLPPFTTVSHSLKSSLVTTLVSYAPLAGKLVHLADTGDVAISCSASDSVKFVVAESDADVQRLVCGEEHDVHTFEQLVPEVDMTVLPASLLAVQATRLEGGGMALGVTVHHGVADGQSLWRFVEAWAAVCRGGTPPPPPTFDRWRVKLPGGEELARSILKKYAPNLPVASTITRDERLRFTHWAFTLDAGHITRLKQRISGCLARLPIQELQSEHALAAAALAVQGAILDMVEDPVAGWDFLKVVSGLPKNRFFNVSGSSSFRAYEVSNFGWGRPRWAQQVRMNKDGQVALLRARDGEGVQVTVAMLERAHMEAFKLEFLKLVME